VVCFVLPFFVVLLFSFLFRGLVLVGLTFMVAYVFFFFFFRCV